MAVFQNDTEFLASLKKAQRDYYLDRFAGLQEQLQSALSDVARGLSTVSALNSDALSVCLTDEGQARRRALVVDGVEYRYSTVPGSGRIKLCRANGTPIAMWSAGRDGPWVLPLKGFEKFRKTGHSDALHQQLLEVDRRRRTR